MLNYAKLMIALLIMLAAPATLIEIRERMVRDESTFIIPHIWAKNPDLFQTRVKKEGSYPYTKMLTTVFPDMKKYWLTPTAPWIFSQVAARSSETTTLGWG